MLLHSNDDWLKEFLTWSSHDTFIVFTRISYLIEMKRM